MNRRIVLPVLLVGLAVAGASFFSSPAFAQDTGTPSNTETAAQYFQRIWASAPSDLKPCGVADTSATSPLWYYCGGVMQDSGTFYGSSNSLSINYQKGDTLNCYVPAVASSASEPVCSLTHNGATTYTEGGFTGASQTCDSSGKCSDTGIVQAAIQNATQGITDLASNVGSQIFLVVAEGVLAFSNWLLGIAGVLFNLVMYYGVFQFGNTVGNSPGVLTAWGILRDLANMALLFGFIFMGIATILNTNAVQGLTAKKALPSLLIFAVLMNFSLFTVEAMIDISNALSSSMYAQANTDPCTGDSAVGSATQALTGTSCGINYGLAGHIMQSTGLAGIWAVHENTPLNVQPWAFFGLALFATVGAIVFFAAAIMLAIRVITLTLLMVVSPIGFAGMAVPPLRKMAGDWWTRVIHQAFYAPIMLLLILISLKIADSFTNVGVNNGLADAITGVDTSVMGVFLVFMLVIGFMVASLIVANRFGAAGATAAVGFGRKIVLGSYGGAAGIAGRRTIGAGSNWAQKQYNKSVASGRLQFLAGSKIDDVVLGGLKKGQDARFGSSKSYKEDKEHHQARHKELAKIDRLAEISKAQTDKEMRDAVKKLSDAEIAESEALKKGGEQLERIARALSSEKFEKLMGSDKISDDRKDEMRNARFKDLHQAVTEADAAAQAFEADPTNRALQDAFNDKQKRLATMANALNGKDMGQLASSTQHSSVFNDPNFASALSEDQFKEAKKNNNLSPIQIQNLETKRNERLNDPVHVENKIKGMSPEEAGKLSGAVLTKRDAAGNFTILDKMTARQLASIDPNKLTGNQAKEVNDYLRDIMTTPGHPIGTAFKSFYDVSPELQRRWP